MRPPFETFKFATCKGSYMLGTACGECEKCAWIRNQAMSNEANLLGRLNRAEFGTADERAVRELLEDRALAKGLLEIIQQALVDQRWQTLGDLYRGKTLFLSQDLLNRIDSALEEKGDG